MQFLQNLDIQMIMIWAFLFISLCFLFSALRARHTTMRVVSESLRLQEQTNHQLLNIFNELKQVSHFLSIQKNGPAEFAGYEEEIGGLTKLYVGNIDYAATENELAQHFSHCGQIEFVNIPINRYTGKTRGFGFITFTSLEDAERAMGLNGSEFRGRPIQVNFAKERD